MELTKQQCEACRPGATPVSETDRATYLERLEGWSIEHENDIPVLVKVYKLADYAASVKFTNAIAAKAEEQDHHPAITLEWGKVTVVHVQIPTKLRICT